MPKPHLALLAALLAAFGLSHFSDKIDPYHLDVLIGIGINIILAVSLNLVNGYTGQFSLGHAGFMSVGAYLAAAVSLAACYDATNVTSPAEPAAARLAAAAERIECRTQDFLRPWVPSVWRSSLN